MSQPSQSHSDQNPGSGSVPGWIASGLLGLALGAGAGVLGMQAYSKQTAAPAANPAPVANAPGGGAPTGMPAGGMPGMGGGAPPMMGMGGMGGGMGGMM